MRQPAAKAATARRFHRTRVPGAHTEVRCCHFPMSADSAEKEAVWNDVAAALAQEVAADRQVGFITLGDAMLFSTWVFLLQRIGCPDWLEIVPGVTSFAAIAARAKPRWPWSSSRWR